MGHNPTEHVQEHVTHEAAHGGHGHGGQPKWITAAALTAAILAAFAAITGMLATNHLTESTQKRIDSGKVTMEATDNWNFYQAKSNKSSDLDTRAMFYALAETMVKLPEAVAKQKANDLAKRAEYATKVEDEVDPENPQGMKGIQAKAQGLVAKAKSLEELSEKHLASHETFEMSATLFHISIAVAAIAVVAKRKEFWMMSLVGGAVGLYFFGTALAHAPGHEVDHHPGGAEQHGPAVPGGAHAPAGGEHATPAGEHAAPAGGEHAAPAGEHAATAGSEHAVPAAEHAH